MCWTLHTLVTVCVNMHVNIAGWGATNQRSDTMQSACVLCWGTHSAVLHMKAAESLKQFTAHLNGMFSGLSTTATYNGLGLMGCDLHSYGAHFGGLG